MIVARHLEKRYGPKRVLRDLSFSLDRGGTLLVTGPNGSGKTTLLRLIAGLAAPTKGQLEVQVDGQPVAEFEVPTRHSPEAPAPLVVSLADYCGPPITVEVIQRAQGEGAVVEWRGIALAGPAAE